MKKVLVALIILSLFGCKKEKTISQQPTKTVQINGEIKIKPAKKQIQLGDSISVTFSPASQIDSFELYFDDSLILRHLGFEKKFSYTISTQKVTKLGQHYIYIYAYKNGQSRAFSKTITLLSNFKPKHYTYKIIKTYPHDRNAYTQGLIYIDDTLYEATGLKGESSIRKEILETGQIIQSIVVPSNVFGEGITIWKNKLIELTWQAHIGFVYNKYTLEKIGQFSYSTEGWGLTNDDKYLIMSDGTNIITFLDPDTYTPVKQIQVFDNKGPVKLLNELEYINGNIYANVYTKNYIVIINPHSGAVEAYINLKGLLKPSEKDSHTDVLNGIAYDKKRNRLLVTGKNWPKIFWIKLISQ